MANHVLGKLKESLADQDHFLEELKEARKAFQNFNFVKRIDHAIEYSEELSVLILATITELESVDYQPKPNKRIEGEEV